MSERDECYFQDRVFNSQVKTLRSPFPLCQSNWQGSRQCPLQQMAPEGRVMWSPALSWSVGTWSENKAFLFVLFRHWDLGRCLLLWHTLARADPCTNLTPTLQRRKLSPRRVTCLCYDIWVIKSQGPDSPSPSLSVSHYASTLGAPGMGAWHLACVTSCPFHRNELSPHSLWEEMEAKTVQQVYRIWTYDHLIQAHILPLTPSCLTSANKIF